MIVAPCLESTHTCARLFFPFSFVPPFTSVSISTAPRTWPASQQPSQPFHTHATTASDCRSLAFSQTALHAIARPTL